MGTILILFFWEESGKLIHKAEERNQQWSEDRTKHADVIVFNKLNLKKLAGFLQFLDHWISQLDIRLYGPKS